MTEAVALARDDPAAARQLLSTLSALTRSEMAFHGVRDDLIALGVPSEHLPRTLGEQRLLVMVNMTSALASVPMAALPAMEDSNIRGSFQERGYGS